MARGWAKGEVRVDRRRHVNAKGDIERVVLRRTDLAAVDLEAFRGRMWTLVERLYQRIEVNEFQVLRAVTPDGGIPHETLALIARILEYEEDFIAPAAGPR